MAATVLGMSEHLAAYKTARAWLKQARDAEQCLRDAGATDTTKLIEMAEIDYEAFCLLVEAFYALGAEVSQEILDRAQMRPVDELL